MRSVIAADALSWTFVPNVAAGLCASALAYAALVARRWRVRHRIAYRCRWVATADTKRAVGDVRWVASACGMKLAA